MRFIKKSIVFLLASAMFFSITSCKNNIASVTPAISKAVVENVKLKLVDTLYDLNPRTITVCSVADFGAKGDTNTDDTQSFFDAIAYASKLGGGSVYVPKGSYKITKPLVIPKSVYLIGEWFNPDMNPEKITEGSILYCYASKGDFIAKPFLGADSGAGVIGMTIYYPEQTPDFPTVYPATLGAMDSSNGASGFSTFRYVTLVNPYQGVALGPNGNECHVLNNIYMTPLDKGIFINMSTDIGRIENISISKKYYELFDKNVDKEKLNKNLKTNVTGIIIQRSDWQHGYNIHISDLNTGIRFERNFLASDAVDSSNSAFIDVTIENVVTGVNYQYLRKMGSNFINLDIKTDGSADSACIRYSKGYNSGSLITGAVLENNSGPCLIADEGAKGAVSLTNVIFKNYLGTAIKMNGSSISVDQSRFEAVGSPAAILDKTALAATLDRNFYAGEKVVNTNQSTVVLGNNEYSSDSSWNVPVEFIKNPVTSKSDFISITDAKYAAVSDGVTDCTKIFQTALDDMKANGGGIVYVPAGRYMLAGTLTIPTGVELRGVSDGPHHTTSLGTFLYTINSKGDAKGDPFISMEKGSGLSGFSIWYPEQVFNKPVEFPYAIQGKGQDIWIVNVTIANAWQAVDLASYDCGGHFLQFVTGCALKNILTIDQSTKKGYVINCHFNPHFFGRTPKTGLPGGSDANGVEPMMLALFKQMDSKLDGALILGQTTDEFVFDFFSYRQKKGLVFNSSKNGQAFDGKIILSGFDACGRALVSEIDMKKDITVLALCIDSSNYGTVKNSGAGVLKLIAPTLGCWNSIATSGIEVVKGNVLIQSAYFRASASANSGTLISTGGQLNCYSSIFNHVGAILNDNKDFDIPWDTEVLDLKKNGGKYNFKYNIGIEHFGAETPPLSNIMVKFE